MSYMITSSSSSSSSSPFLSPPLALEECLNPRYSCKYQDNLVQTSNDNQTQKIVVLTERAVDSHNERSNEFGGYSVIDLCDNDDNDYHGAYDDEDNENGAFHEDDNENDACDDEDYENGACDEEDYENGACDEEDYENDACNDAEDYDKRARDENNYENGSCDEEDNNNENNDNYDEGSYQSPRFQDVRSDDYSDEASRSTESGTQAYSSNVGIGSSDKNISQTTSYDENFHQNKREQSYSHYSHLETTEASGVPYQNPSYSSSMEEVHNMQPLSLIQQPPPPQKRSRGRPLGWKMDPMKLKKNRKNDVFDFLNADAADRLLFDLSNGRNVLQSNTFKNGKKKKGEPRFNEYVKELLSTVEGNTEKPKKKKTNTKDKSSKYFANSDGFNSVDMVLNNGPTPVIDLSLSDNLPEMKATTRYVDSGLRNERSIRTPKPVRYNPNLRYRPKLNNQLPIHQVNPLTHPAEALRISNSFIERHDFFTKVRHSKRDKTKFKYDRNNNNNNNNNNKSDSDGDISIRFRPSMVIDEQNPDTISGCMESKPLCVRLQILETCCKGVWCKPGRAVGLYVEGVGPPGAQSMMIGVVLDDLTDLMDDTVAEEDVERFVLIAFGGEVPVIVEQEDSFVMSSADDLVCVGSDGSVRLLRAFQAQNLIKKIVPQQSANNSSSNSSSTGNNNVINNESEKINPSNNSFCRPFGFAFRKGSQYNDYGEPVAYLIRGENNSDNNDDESNNSSNNSSSMNNSNIVTAKFHRWLENENELEDTDEWQHVVTSTQPPPPIDADEDAAEKEIDHDMSANNPTSSSSSPSYRRQQVAVVKGIRVVLMQQLDAYSLYQNTLAVKMQTHRFRQLLHAQREIQSKQQIQIEEQNKILDELRGMLSKLEE